MKKLLFLYSALALSSSSFAQNKVEYFPYGDMDNWIRRRVNESAIIGGKEKNLYEITKGKNCMEPNIPYKNMAGSPWATSNVYAHVAVVHKGVNTISPLGRGDGYCAKLETKLESVKVLGMFHLQVIATGTIFLGEMVEPITSTDNANQYLDRGIPFTKSPKELVLDYALRNIPKRMYAGGLGKPKEIEGTNGAEVVAILHKRWEDKNGNIYAKRIAMVWKRLFDEDGKWNNDFRIPFYYGDYSRTPNYAAYMALERDTNPSTHTIYARNSRGEIKPVVETGWGSEEDTPTHLMLSISSGWGGAYMGSPGTILMVDNIGLSY